MRTDPYTVPEYAYRRDVFENSEDSALPSQDFDYRYYEFLGRISMTRVPDYYDALAEARAKFGKAARVFAAGAWWVAHRV